MCAQALAIAKELDDFPGGARALAASITASAEAMRPLRWPAERLDTLGGYLTFHNVVLFNLFLAVYGVVVGAKVLRGAEERHSAEEDLATGTSRGLLLRGRTVGFVLMAAVVAAGLTVGTAAGLGSLLLVVLYIATNVDGKVAGAGVLAAVSPFTLANKSRALVPGYGLDLWATLALVAVIVTMLALAEAAGDRRDYGAPLWRRQAAETQPHGHVSRFMLRSVETATLRRGSLGLAVWTAASAAFVAMMGALQPDIIDVWSDMGYLVAFGGEGGAVSSYWSFSMSLLPAVLAAYAVTQTSTWVNELQQGRVEMLRAAGVSWTRLVTGRLVALVTGSAVIVIVSTGALAAVAASVGSPLDAAGTARVAAVSLLFAAATGSVASLVAALVRRSSAVIALGVLVGASYLLTYLVPLFGWPGWLNRLSVFWAFGTPYVEWPSTAQLATLLVLTVGGYVAAVVVAEQSPSVA